MSGAPSIERDSRLLVTMPPRWVAVPLDDDASIESGVRRLAREAVGLADDAAIARRELSESLVRHAREARDGGAVLWCASIEVLPKLPITASFAVFPTPNRISPAVGADGDRVIDVIVQGLAAQQGVPVEDVHRFRTRQSSVARVERIVERAQPVDGDEQHLERALIIDYWLSVPGRKRATLVSCSTPMVDLADAMRSLFDAIVRGTSWDLAPAVESAGAR